MRKSIYNFGPFQLDTGEQILLRDGQSLPLKPKVFDVLAALVENSGRVVCKDELMKMVWADSFVEEGNLAVSIFEIRKALGGSPNGHRYIETVPRRGYRFVACVTEASTQRLSQQADGTDIALANKRGASVTIPNKGAIAVLPFTHIGPTGREYLGLGMADALITRLSNLRRVIVRPTSSVRKYEGAQDPVSVGKELGVEWVLDGSVQKSGKRIRLTVQLVDVSNGALLWGEKFDEKFRDILSVEDSISEQVAIALAPKVTGEEKRALAKRYTENAVAYNAYLKGRYFFDKKTIEGCKKSIQYLGQAISADPHFALAYATLADCYDTLRLFSVLPSQEANSKAESAILSALDLDFELAEAHSALALLRTRQWNWSVAEKEFKLASELNPNYARTHSGYAICLVELGRDEEALAEIKRARNLDPLSLMINTTVASILYFTRQYDEAIEQAYRTLEMDAHFSIASVCLGVAYEAQGKYEEALTAFRTARKGLRDIPELPASLARIDALSGRRDKALEVIDKLIHMPRKRCVQSSFIAMIYAALGDKNEAFRWLDRAFTEHDDTLALLKVDPRWDGLRADPRFGSLLKQVGLAHSNHLRSSH